MIKKIIFIYIVILTFGNNAYAYLDPGTGGIILQTLLAILAGIIFFFRQTLDKLKNVYLKLTSYLKKKE